MISRSMQIQQFMVSSENRGPVKYCVSLRSSLTPRMEFTEVTEFFLPLRRCYAGVTQVTEVLSGYRGDYNACTICFKCYRGDYGACAICFTGYGGDYDACTICYAGYGGGYDACTICLTCYKGVTQVTGVLCRCYGVIFPLRRYLTEVPYGGILQRYLTEVPYGGTLQRYLTEVLLLIQIDTEIRNAA